jgi:hypothetical protein
MASASRSAARAVRTVTVVALLASTTDAAAEVGAQVGARLAHTDNITLASEGATEAENIAEVTAGIDFERTQPRLDSQVSYQAQGVFYADSSESNEVFHTLDASTELALVLDRLYLDAFAVHDQTVSDPTGKYSFNKLALTGNRTDVTVVGASPFLVFNAGGNVTGEARYDYSRFNYDDPDLQDADARVGSLTLGNSSRRGAGWGIAYYNQRFEYDRDIEFESFETELGFWPTETLRLFTQQGLESDYRLVQPNTPGAASPGLDDHYWYVGAEWQPSERQTVELATGERNFGRSNRFAWSRRSRGGGINVSYDETPSSFLADQISSARIVGELTPIDALAGPNGNLFYLQKVWNVSFVLDGNRTSSGLRFFSEKRFDIARAVEDNDDHAQMENFRGTELSFSLDLNSRAAVTASAQFARRSSSLNVVNDKFTYLWAAWNRDLGRQTQLVVSVSRERSEPQAAVGFDYEENQTGVSISRSFGTRSGGGVPPRFSGYLNAAQGR